MDETMNENNQKGGSKKLLAIILVAVLVVAGAVAAFALLNKSPKAKYFLAEKQSFDKVAEHVKEQYQPEVDWYEITQKNPVKNDFELTGNYESPYGGFSTDDMFSPEQIVNNSKLKVSTQTDLENKKATMTLNGSMGEIETGDIAFSIDSHKLSAKLPFLDELLQIKDKDLAKLMNEADPMNENKFTLDFTKFFEKSSVPEEDLEYLKKEYLDMIYDELPGDAFKSSDKKIDVDGKSTDTEKITMHLTEQNVKDILSKLFTKAEKDKKLKNIIKEQYEMQQFGSSFADSSMTGMQSADDLVKDFTDAMKEANKNLKDFHIPDGLTSTIWVKDNTIVKRDFSVKMGPEKDQLVTLKANGTQSLGEKEQKFAYTLGFKDDFSDGKMDIDGTLSNKDGKINDSIKLSVNQFEAVYEADETLKDGKRDFERKITATDKDSQTTGSLTWSGDATYEKDQMNSNNKVSLDGEFLEGAKVAVNLKKSAKTVKEVELPKADQTKDMGTMSVEEIQDYFMNDVAPKAQQYFLQMLGPSW